MRAPIALLPFACLLSGCDPDPAELLAAEASPASAAPAEDEISQEELERMTEAIKVEVEELRGAKFTGPVRVAVTDTKGFRDYVTKRLERMVTPEELAADEEVAKLLGVLPADYPYLDEMLELVEAQVGGFYDPQSKSFYLMSTFTGGMARIILAHELTHALDDQLFDIDTAMQERRSNSDALWAYQAVVEGSGTAVMSRWTMKNMFELDREELQESASMGMDELAEAPTYLWKPLLGSYTKGQSFLNKAPDDLGLAEGIARAFQSPPLSSEQVLHPEKYWDPEERDDPVLVELDREALPAGWKVLDEDTLGELGLGLMIEPLEKRGGVGNAMAAMTARLTWKAVKGWGGDRYALLGKGDDRLLVLATVWDREKDATEFEREVEELRAHLEQSGAALHVARQEDRVHVALATGAGVDLAADSAGWARISR
ncbi:MAG: hypothetical protein AAF682_21895 [Planctomycetota bacterium]